MERYTEKHYDGNGYYLICSGNCETLNCGDCGILDKIVDRLAAYEETGLEPEEVRRCLEFEDICLDEYIKHERLHELAQADREGRCVVLPCKVGQKVKVDVRTWGNIWNYRTVDYGKFLLGEIVAITKTKKQTLVKIRVEHNLSWKRPTRRYPASAIGKTVFLTREEDALVVRSE